MACSVTIPILLHGKKENGFYSNVDKITKWQEEYNFPHGVVDLFDEPIIMERHQHIYRRAYFTVYVFLMKGMMLRSVQCMI